MSDQIIAQDKLHAVAIEVSRAEGRHEECVTRRVDLKGDNYSYVWLLADRVLRSWAWSAPDNGSYHKCDFTITYSNGHTYSGRYDLKRHDIDFSNLLGRHINQFAGCCAGTLRPDWPNDQEWAEMQARHREMGIDQEYKNFLTRYQVGY